MAASDVLYITAIISVIGLVFFIGYYTVDTMVTEVTSVPVVSASGNATGAFNSIAENTTEKLDYVLFAVFIGFILALLVSSWVVGAHPVFMMAYFIVIVVSVVVGMFLSNVWDEVTSMTIFGTTINNFTLTNNIMSNFALYMAVVGVLGMIIMFAKPYISQGVEG